MQTASFLKKAIVESPLAQAQMLGNKGRSTKKHLDLAPILPLTSLIDAFCIIVIYLLIGTQSGGAEMALPNHMTLPSAETGVATDDATIVRIQNGQYFINDRQVAVSNLGAQLASIKNNLAKGDDMQIIVQADTKMNYADLDPLIKAGSEAQIQKLKFAVMPAK